MFAIYIFGGAGHYLCTSYMCTNDSRPKSCARSLLWSAQQGKGKPATARLKITEQGVFYYYCCLSFRMHAYNFRFIIGNTGLYLEVIWRFSLLQASMGGDRTSLCVLYTSLCLLRCTTYG